MRGVIKLAKPIDELSLDLDENSLDVNGYVRVVRCKDCIHRPTGTGANHDIEFPDDRCPCQCEDYWYSWMPRDNWFCANGERKETEDGVH